MSRRFIRASRWARWLILAGLLSTSPVLGKPRVHTVYAGQRLGSIAKRYNVTVEELCQANGISQKDPIRPGQKLIIPDKNAPPEPPTKAKVGTAETGAKKATGGSSKSATKPGPPRLHVVQRGHTLGAIGGRYAVTVSAICNANGIPRNHALTVGQKLIIPAKTDRDGSYARELRLAGRFDPDAETRREPEDRTRSSHAPATWAPYVKPAWRRGFIKIRRYGRAWQGYVIGPKDEVLGYASSKINYVMGTHDGGPQIHPRLVRLIAHVSDKFGGRELRIVSGYRTKSFVAASKHKEGRAIDFSIPGIPNEVLRDYLRTLEDVGVGYYPNSSFIHLDVRGYNAYWIDYAGPGEAPRKAPRSKKRSDSGAEADEVESEEWHGPEEDPDGDGVAAGGSEQARGDEPDPSAGREGASRSARERTPATEPETKKSEHKQSGDGEARAEAESDVSGAEE